ncbi:MAG: UvrD-helicase domain-containing protein [Blastocatellales bacterium]|nr:UvrD-helicase domain-containing protein [Blastocatellales bacterium]
MNYEAALGAADHLSGLNDGQRDAASTAEGPVLILAGAGSGKTRVITHRIAHLIESCGVRPESILAVTFTNKAAGEMKERVEKLLAGYYARGGRSGAPLLSTFHSLCVRILRRDIERLERSYTRAFTIYDADDQERLVKAIIKDLGLDDRGITPRLARSAISGAKNRGQDPQAYAAKADWVDEKREQLARIYGVYEQRLEASNALDFDDLLIRAVQLLRKSEDVRRYYHERFRHVMIDEFQDTNGIQYALARLIVEGDAALNLKARPEDFWSNRSLCVVGDESQSIYGWRGSDFKIILGFEQDFPGTKVVKLEDNYRSTRRILDAANHVIAKNTERFDKELRANSGEGENLRYAQLQDAESEARWVIGRIEDHLLRDAKARAAVLYRTNAQSRVFEEACLRSGLAYNIVGGFRFYERAEVKDVIAYLKLAVNAQDSMSLLRVINTPTRGIGKSTIDDIERRSRDYGVSHWETIAIVIEQNLLPPRAVAALRSFREIIQGLAAKTSTERLSEVVKAAVIDTGYERALKEENNDEAEARLANLEELVSAAVEGERQGETLRDFLDHAALVADTDEYKASAQVTLMTMHAAKGLEFPIVFIVGLEEGLFPNPRANDKQSEMEEERRLCYVAITRAERHLYLSHATLRRVYGEQMPTQPSRFLNEFPPRLIEDMSPAPSWLGRGGGHGEARRTSNYQGRTYNNADSVREFFSRKSGQNTPKPSGSKPRKEAVGGSGLQPGVRVRHSKYGQGLIVRREGEGENAKLTVRFPGYGDKKLIEKYAGLEILRG